MQVAGTRCRSAIAVRDGDGDRHASCRGRPDLRVQARFRQQFSSEARALTWQFREPIATLIVDGKSIGRHYAGPNWDHIDGSGVKGKVGRQRARRDPERYSLAQTRRGRPSRQRHLVRCDDRPAHQHQRRGRARILRKSQGLPQRALFRGLCVSARERLMREPRLLWGARSLEADGETANVRLVCGFERPLSRVSCNSISTTSWSWRRPILTTWSSTIRTG